MLAKRETPYDMHYDERNEKPGTAARGNTVSSALLASGVRRSLAQIRYVSPVLPGEASGLVACVYDQAERDFGLVAPPLVLHSPAPRALAAAWLMLRETLLATGSAAREQKEVVAAAVSVANECPYCVAVHSSAVRGLIGGSVPAQLAAGRFEEIADPALRDVATWAVSAGRPGMAVPAPAPVPVDSFPEIAGVAVTFHYLNRMVSIFLPDSPLPPLTPKPMGGWVMGMLASAMLAPAPVPGASLDLLPDAPLPAEFCWAADQPHVAGALARAAATIEKAGQGIVPEPVREIVLDRLRGWDGRPPDMDRGWAEKSAAGLAAADRPAGRLALLAAFAPYQVTQDDIREVKSTWSEALILLTAWASMAAARTIASSLRAR
jgi:AhpD family alkylhydroperoxidase